MFGDLSPLLEVMCVLTRIFLLMHYQHHFTSTILWPCYIVTEYHTPTSFSLDGAILQIDIAKTWLFIYAPRALC